MHEAERAVVTYTPKVSAEELERQRQYAYDSIRWGLGSRNSCSGISDFFDRLANSKPPRMIGGDCCD
jgi:hypothetical protein